MEAIVVITSLSRNWTRPYPLEVIYNEFTHSKYTRTKMLSPEGLRISTQWHYVTVKTLWVKFKFNLICLKF